MNFSKALEELRAERAELDRLIQIFESFEEREQAKGNKAGHEHVTAEASRQAANQPSNGALR